MFMLLYKMLEKIQQGKKSELVDKKDFVHGKIMTKLWLNFVHD